MKAGPSSFIDLSENALLSMQKIKSLNFLFTNHSSS